MLLIRLNSSANLSKLMDLGVPNSLQGAQVVFWVGFCVCLLMATRLRKGAAKASPLAARRWLAVSNRCASVPND